jgi:phosphomannomutase
MQGKKKKADIKINEVLALVLTYLRSKKDAKGGVATNVSTSRGIQSRQHNQATCGI